MLGLCLLFLGPELNSRETFVRIPVPILAGNRLHFANSKKTCNTILHRTDLFSTPECEYGAVCWRRRYSHNSVYIYINRYPISCIQYGNIPIRNSPSPHPTPCHPPLAPLRTAPAWGGVGGNPLWVYFHIGCRILYTYINMYIHLSLYKYIYTYGEIQLRLRLRPRLCLRLPTYGTAYIPTYARYCVPTSQAGINTKGNLVHIYI